MKNKHIFLLIVYYFSLSGIFLDSYILIIYRDKIQYTDNMNVLIQG